MKPPLKGPNHPAILGWIPTISIPLSAKQQSPSRQPFVASYSDEPACWWKLTNSTKPGGRRQLWWAPMGARRWHECPEFIRPDDEGDLSMGGVHPTTFQTYKERVKRTLLMLHEAALNQACDRLNRRASDARRRQAQKPAHPPRKCSCCC